jgi:phage FluMu protein gp41
MLLPGYNDNIRLNDEVYHVQTETRGAKEAPYIVTLVFTEGKILYRRKTEWLGAVDSPEALKQFKELLNEQHSDIIKQLKNDTLERADAEEQKRIEMDEKKLIARFLDEWASE